MKRPVFQSLLGAASIAATRDGLLSRLVTTIVAFSVTLTAASAAFRDLWNWFAAPIFGQPIRIAEAAGLLLLIFLCKLFLAYPTATPDREQAWTKIARLIARLLAIGTVWIFGRGIESFLV